MPANLAGLLRLLPRGVLSADEGTVLYALLYGVALAADGVDGQADELLVEATPHLTTDDGLLARWEELYELLAGAADEATRRTRLVAYVQRIPDLRPATILALVEQWSSLNWTLTEPTTARYDEATYGDPYLMMDGAFVFILEADSLDALAGELERAKLDAFLELIKPAHCLARVRFTGELRYDDPYSTYDLDLLGE